MIEAHRPMIARAVRADQERQVVLGGLLVLLGLGVELLSWTGTASAGEKIGLALGVAAIVLTPAAILLRRGLARVPPLLRRLDQRPPDVRSVEVAYVSRGEVTVADVRFVFGDRRRWRVVLPADVGQALARELAPERRR
jgi:hypothetical protein